MLCMDLVFGFVDLGIVYLVQSPCNQVDFENPIYSISFLNVLDLELL